MADNATGRITPPAFVNSPPLLAVFAVLPEARIVGGAVRDTLAGRIVHDIDLATPRDPVAVTAALEAAGIRVLPTGLAHGTVTALSQGIPYEITTLRRDRETDGRHAQVEWTDDWRQDAARRDFTFNALSMASDGSLWDYFGGQADLAAGTVRFVGDPAQRIAEDYLRILRFFRFHARYAHGPADPAPLAALRAGIPGLSRLSPERVWWELKGILSTPDPREAVALMAELGVLEALVPGADAAGLMRLPPDAPADPLLRLAALRHDAAALAEPLRMSAQERDTLLGFAGPAPDQSMDDATLRRLLADTPSTALIGRAWLAGGGLVLRRLTSERPTFPLEGRDIVAEGVAPGPAVGVRLRAMRDWWIAGGCVADHAACVAQLRRQLAADRLAADQLAADGGR